MRRKDGKDQAGEDQAGVGPGVTRSRGRPRGARDPSYEARRRDLLTRLTARLTQQDAMHASFRDLAAAADVSLATLQHYFGSRAPLIEAALRQAHRDAAPLLERMRQPEGGFAQSIRAALAFIRLGLEEFGVAGLYSLGLSEGLRHQILGPVFLQTILDPSLEAITARLAVHQARGEMRADCAPRDGAIMLAAPVILLVLHQRELGGEGCAPADRAGFMESHAEAFIRAHGTGV